MYAIKPDALRGLVEVTVSGFWTIDEFQAFTRALNAELARWPVDAPPASLYNYTDAAIQSQEVVALMQALAKGVAPGRRVALYTEGRLARMQARRVAMAGSRMRVFENRADAIGWLTDSADSFHAAA